MKSGGGGFGFVTEPSDSVRVLEDKLGRNYVVIVSLAFIVPSFAVAFCDLRRSPPPRFSVAHTIFFVGCLYSLSFQAAQIDSLILA